MTSGEAASGESTSGEAAGQGGGDVESLRHTVEELEEENEALRASKQDAPSRHRWRRIGSWVLLVVACLLAVVSVLVVWVRNEVLSTDAYVSTVAPLAKDPAIQAAVATKVSQNLVTHTDLQNRVKSALPTRAGFLAGPITSGVESTTHQITLKAVQSDRFQQFWVNANRRAHDQVVALLTGSDEKALQAKNGEVVLDLSQVQAQATHALDARGITVFDKVNVKAPTLVLFRSSQVTKLQRLIRFLDHLALVLPILTLLGFAGVVLLSLNRRRGLVRAAAGLAVSMALVLVVAAVARNQYLSSLRPEQPKDAAAAVFDAVSALLLDSVRTILIIAALVAVGALVAGNRWVRSWWASRHWPRWMTEGPVPGFVGEHRRGLQWATLGLGLLVIVAWSNPTTLVVVVVVLVALGVVGLLGLYGRHPPPASAVNGAGLPGAGPPEETPAPG